MLSKIASKHAQNFETWGEMATTAEDHIVFHASQPRTGIWGYHEHRITEARQFKKISFSWPVSVWCYAFSRWNMIT